MNADGLSRIAMSSGLAASLSHATEYARAQGHVEVTLEHMLLALCEDPDAALVLASSNINIAELSAEVAQQLSALPTRSYGGQGDLAVAGDLRRILEAAAAAARGGRRREINGAIVLAAIIGDGKSAAAHILSSLGLTFEGAIRALQSKPAPAPDTVPRTQPPADAEAILANARERVQSRTGLRERLAPLANRPVREEPPPAAEPWPEPEAHEAPAEAPIQEPLPPVHEPEELPPQAAEQAPRWEPMPAPVPPPKPVGAAHSSRSEPEPPPEPQFDPAPASYGDPPPDDYGQAPYEGDGFVEAADRDAQAYEPAPELSEPYNEPAPDFGLPPMPASPPFPPPIPPPIPSQGRLEGWAPAPSPAPAGGRLGPSSPQPPPIPFPAASGPVRPGPPPTAPWPEEPALPMAIGGAGARGAPPAPPPPGSYRQSAPIPAVKPPSAAPRRGGQRTEIGQLVENIPRSMRVAVPAMIEVRIARADVKALADGLQGGGAAYQHEVTVTKAMSVRLRAPDGGFYIETASPETQWIERTMQLAEEDFASWRWHVTPRETGRKRLQLIISARTVSADGLAAETALPDQVITVRVRTNYGQAASRWIGWGVAAVAGGLLAKFGEGAFAILGRVLHG